MVVMEWLLVDEDVWSVELEYRLKRAILLIRPLDRAQTFTEAVFLSVAMNGYSVTRMSCRSNLSIGSKAPYLLIRPLDRAQTFTKAVFLGVAMERLLGDEDV
jgi:hypothetical protein